MEPVVQDTELVKRAYWLIRLRWIAIVFVGAATFICSDILAITLHDFALYSIAILLALYNTTVFLLLNHLTGNNHDVPKPAVKKIINFQISADLLILTVLLHFSGGIENPFAFYFIFHMIIASILLSVRESYLQATFAVLIFGLLILLEYLQIIPHYCLSGFVERCLHRDGPFVFGTYFVFATALYVAVYMATYVATRLRRAEQAHRQANVLLSKKDRVKDEYVLRLTHDIKGHLAAIQSCLDVVANKLIGSLNEQQDDFISRANSRIHKVTRFVKTLLKLTRMRLGDDLEMSEFSLRNSIRGVVAAAEAKVREKSVSLNCNIEPTVDKVFGSGLSVEEVTTNLLANAIKYTPANGTVDVNVKDKDDYILVEVTDTGIGIPAEELPHIFDECYRATNAKEIEKDGTGLGLSVAKQIVENCGGNIGVESRENNGSRFWFTLLKRPGGTSRHDPGGPAKHARG